MHYHQKRIVIISSFLLALTLPAWTQVAMGKWKTHLAYNNASQVAQSTNKVYAVSEGALFSVDKADGGLSFYSKLTGLNGSNISKIKFNAASQELLIIYSNGNIDVIGNSGITNMPDLYNKQMSSGKTVNQIQFYQNKAYLACNFGIVVLNLDKKEVADTYYIGPNASEVAVLSTTIHNGTIYALSKSAVYKASAAETQLANYEFWSTASGLPGTGDFQNISSFGGKLILLRGGKLYKQESNNTWTSFLSDITPTNFTISNGSLNIFSGSETYLVDTLFNSKVVNGITNISDAEYDPSNHTYWFAANSLGVVSYKQLSTETPTVTYFKPTGPAVNSPWNMTFAGKKLFVVPGGRWASQYLTDGNIMMYENSTWTNINSKTIQDKTGYPVTDLMNVAVDSTDSKHFFVTSYGTGLYEFKDNTFAHWYNNNNSNLETIIPTNPYQYIRLDGAVFDKQGNLLMCNMNVKNGIKVRLANGTWTQLSYPGTNDKPTLGKILISNQNQNQKWIPSVRYTPGLCVFDDNGTLTDQSDDKSVFFSSFIFPELDNNGNTKLVTITPSFVYTVSQDKNGVVWVGTDQGPFLFNNISKVFQSGYTCSRVKIARADSTNLADYLLVNEKIKAIAIDGANRKWLGTETSGVYLMSENGQKTIQHFTASNSPLLSDNILSIAINPSTGEVFFGTDAGLVSFQSDASEAGDSFNNVHAYPNPVRPNYRGVITIAGLVEKAQVKITDINGNLVCETVSNGSLATWDGKDAHGRRVNTGIYLVICASSDGTQNAITKILFIN